MQELMGNAMDFYEVGKKELCEHECDPHALTRTRTLRVGGLASQSSKVFKPILSS